MTIPEIPPVMAVVISIIIGVATFVFVAATLGLNT